MKGTEFLTELESLTESELNNIKGVGPNITASFLTFLKSKRFERIKKRLIELESKNISFEVLETSKPKTQNLNANLPFSGQKVVITGTFEITRDEIKKKVEELGGDVGDTVNSTTTILFAGQKAGSKLEKAKKLGIRIFETLEVFDNPNLLK
jgi:DNA ligase (NAD+)